MRRIIGCVLIIGLTSATAVGAQGLGFLDHVFGNVSDVNASRLFGKPYSGRGVIAGSRLSGLGIEVTFDAGAILSRAHKGCSATTRDSTLTEVRVRYEGREVRESTLVYGIKPAACEDDSWLDAELGFGYTLMQGIRGLSGLQGSIEELPVASLYLVVFPKSPVQPYVGLITGLTQLKDFRAVGDSGLISASGSTFEYGALFGIGITLTDRAALIGEIGWVAREFEGLNWTANGGRTAVVPTALQAPIRLSTRILSIGGQIRFKRGNE